MLYQPWSSSTASVWAEAMNSLWQIWTGSEIGVAVPVTGALVTVAVTVVIVLVLLVVLALAVISGSRSLLW